MDLHFQNIMSEGDFEPANSLNQHLSDGEFWAYQPPFTLVYRMNQGYTPREGVYVYGRMAEDVTTVTLDAHDLTQVAAGTGYDFYFADIGHSGKRGDVSDYRRIFFDDNGMIVSVGNPAINLQGKAVAAGKFDLTFTYNQVGEPATPSGFKIYEDSSALNLVTTIGLIAGRPRYYVTTGAYSHGSSREFLVRTFRTVAGTDYEDKNLDFITLVADSTGPSAITVIRTSH